MNAKQIEMVLEAMKDEGLYKRYECLERIVIELAEELEKRSQWALKELERMKGK